VKVRVAGWAWLPRADLTEMQLAGLKAKLTIYPKKVGDHPGDPPGPVYLFNDKEPGLIGVPRQYFLSNRRTGHEVELDVTDGRADMWPGPLKFSGTLRPDQQTALKTVVGQFRTGSLGGVVRAVTGWGKTTWSCGLIAEMGVPTLVVVHKEFLMNQWKERIAQFLPDAKVGLIQQDECDFQGKHIAIAMVHSIAGRDYGPLFKEWPGLVITDEVHRIGAETWSAVPPMFKARWRLGVSATPRRKDGADNVFNFHIGSILYASTEQRMKPKVRKVWTNFNLVQTASLNPNLVSKNLLLKFMCMNKARNKVVAEQLVLAIVAGRKLLVLSERLKHLSDLEAELRAQWKQEAGPVPTVGYYVGGMGEDALDEAAKAQVIFATTQFASEGLDIPALDTAFLTVPMGDVEQACGRILRPFEGKKDPVIVDFRDEKVNLCVKMGGHRDRFYVKMGWVA